jgi:uncharacterized protein
VEAVTIVTDDGLSLEGELRFPEEPARASAVLCHPHPRHGGSKDHPILWAVRAELSSRGLAVLSFNFRGNMGSEGSYGDGVEEVADARAAIDVVRTRVEGPTFLFGWSFGASVALREVVEDRRVEALALLGFPLGDSVQLPPPPPDEQLAALTTPVLLVAGDSDPFCPVDRLLELGGRIPKAEIEIVRGGDHYFPRREREVAALVGGFAGRTLLASDEGLAG